MRWRFDNLRNDSSLDALDRRTNESNNNFARPVVGVRKARRFASSKVVQAPDGRLSFVGVACVSPASVIRQGFNRLTKGSGLTTCCRGQMAKLPSRVKEIEMKVNGVLPVEPEKAISEGEKRKAWLHTESRPIDSMRNLSQKREGKSLLPPPESIPEPEQTELVLNEENTMCSKCQKNEAYLNIGWCEPCLYELVETQEK